MKRTALLLLLILTSALRAGDDLKLSPGEFLLTLVATNDIHGGLLPSPHLDRETRTTTVLGGFEWVAGAVRAIREHHRKHYGDRARVLLLDAGDAVQGSLLSNHSEGLLQIRAMNRVGYDAAIVGNHGFDFGPVGWELDVVPRGRVDLDPLGALRRYVDAARFPFLGANVTMRPSGRNLPRLRPYVLVEAFRGLKLALIGIENEGTKNLTLSSNVEELHFADGTTTLVNLVDRLWEAEQADVFAALVHEGDAGQRSLRGFLSRLPRRVTGEPLLDAAFGGHTHRLNDAVAGGIPYIQSYSNGTHLGWIQLVLREDARSGRLQVVRHRTRRRAGIPVPPEEHQLLGETVRADPEVKGLIERGRAEVARLGERVLARARGEVSREGGRLADSTMGNLVTDMVREAAGVDVAMVNSGDVRDGLPAGAVTYEHLFEALPKNSQLLRLEGVPVSLLVANLSRSAETCGRRGAMQLSGLRVEFSRDCGCPESRVRGYDPAARIDRIRALDGRLLYERRGLEIHVAEETVSVMTTDFVVSGGAGYPGFPELLVRGESRILREVVAAGLEAQGTLDPAAYAPGRWVEAPPRCPRRRR